MSDKYTRHRWMVCDVGPGFRRETPCLFDEANGLRRGDPPRCIRHGALLFSDKTLDGLTRKQAKKRIDEGAMR